MNNDRLKFRVFDTFHNKYIPIMKDEITGAEGFAAFYSQYNNLCKPMSFFLCHQDNIDGHDRYIIEQCTGLRDENDNLIYEGDIIKCEIDIERELSVVWDDGCFGVYVPTHDDFVKFYTLGNFTKHEWEVKNIEIIGNIHEQKDKQ